MADGALLIRPTLVQIPYQRVKIPDEHVQTPYVRVQTPYERVQTPYVRVFVYQIQAASKMTKPITPATARIINQ